MTNEQHQEASKRSLSQKEEEIRKVEDDGALDAALRPEAPPAHVAIIMDGNGAMGSAPAGLPRTKGHRQAGAEAASARRWCGAAARWASRRYLTLYSFSTGELAPPGGRDARRS